jgi:hypothetical protein
MRTQHTCKIGFATNTSAGRTPANKLPMPSLLIIANSVPIVLGRFAFGSCPVCTPFSRSAAEVGAVELASALRAVMRVLTTQIGFVQRTVAEPARAPASIDSMVVRRREERPEARARRSKKERDHSYPAGGVSQDVATMEGESQSVRME